ncbi:uncharacterized protein LOC143148368 [Ptiloglossa arizonensis]|uniref:uncharacterized protein LOC143148368 n=1 Tax=Ptiloglossa arizonensis TaxID=3350558 RepID=UPI003F9F5CE8
MQVMSGHGCFAQYLHRIGKEAITRCWYYPGGCNWEGSLATERRELCLAAKETGWTTSTVRGSHGHHAALDIILFAVPGVPLKSCENDHRGSFSGYSRNLALLSTPPNGITGSL